MVCVMIAPLASPFHDLRFSCNGSFVSASLCLSHLQFEVIFCFLFAGYNAILEKFKCFDKLTIDLMLLNLGKIEREALDSFVAELACSKHQDLDLDFQSELRSTFGLQRMFGCIGSKVKQSMLPHLSESKQNEVDELVKEAFCIADSETNASTTRSEILLSFLDHSNSSTHHAVD